jgi:hypothetical protein
MTTELHWEVVAVERRRPSVIDADGFWTPSHMLILRTNARKKQRTNLSDFRRRP